MIPTKVTPGKSNPFVTICVPSREIDFSRAKGAKDRSCRAALSDRVQVEPGQARRREEARDLALDLLDSDPAEPEIRRAAAAARDLKPARGPAVMAAKHRFLGVNGERNVAPGAVRHGAASTAL
jgi:hypothetical protein